MVTARRLANRAWIVPVLIVLASIVVVAPAGADPTLRVIPTPTTQGSPVSVFGAGFCGSPSCPPVRLLVDGREVATEAAQPDGSVRFDVLAPSPPNQHVVVAEQAGAVVSSATAGLLVVPSDTAPPPSGSRPTGPPSTPRSTPRTTNDGRPTSTASSSPSTASGPSSTPGADGTAAAAGRSARDRANESDAAWYWLAILVGLAVVAALLVAARRRRCRRHGSPTA